MGLKKSNYDDSIIWQKAHLVFKRYEETYLPVVCYNTIRFLLSLAGKCDLDVDQMNTGFFIE